MWIHKKRCTAETDGTVMNIQGKGSEGLTVITVEYEVKNQKYQIKESIKLKSTVIRIGFLPIGQRKTPRMPNKIQHKNEKSTENLQFNNQFVNAHSKHYDYGITDILLQNRKRNGIPGVFRNFDISNHFPYFWYLWNSSCS